MKIQLILKSILVLTLCVYQINSSWSECDCKEPDLDYEVKPEFGISNDDQIIEGKNYGKLVKISTIIQLEKDASCFDSQLYKNFQLKHDCPAGFAPPTKDQVQEIVSFATYNQLVDQANYTTDIDYASGTSTNQVQKTNWNFFGMKVSKNSQSVNLRVVHTWFSKSDAYLKSQNIDDRKCLVKCVLQTENLDPNRLTSLVNGLSNFDLLKDDKLSLSVKNNVNIIDQQWNFQDGTQSNKSSIDFVAKSGDKQCGALQIIITLFGGIKLPFCKIYHTKDYSGNTNLEGRVTSQDDLSQKNISGVQYAQRQSRMHFESGTAPLSPTSDGGAYILYTERLSKSLFVIKIDKKGEVLQRIDLGYKGTAFDIATTPFGFVYMAKDYPENCYVKAYNVVEGQQRWSKTITNNGSKPDQSTTIDQIDLNGGFGSNLMYEPHNGRLQYARGKIFVIWAHYNQFVTQGSHTGDSSVLIDADKGVDFQILFTWGSSHSLVQRVLYDGQFIYTATLGDAYPESIRNYKFSDIDKEIAQTQQTNGQDLCEPQYIPGNARGKAQGRLGMLVNIREDLNVQIYSQRPGQGQNRNAPSEVDQFSAVFFNSQTFELLSQVKLGSGLNVNTIKCAKYGNNAVIIGYTLANSDTSAYWKKRYNEDWLPTRVKESDQMNIMIISDTGVILKQFTVNTTSISASDDWKVLSDGRVAWTYVTSKGVLEYHYTQGTQTNDTQEEDTEETQESVTEVVETTEETQESVTEVVETTEETSESEVEEDQICYDSAHSKKHLRGWTSFGRQAFSTVEQAQVQCSITPDCGGVTQWRTFGFYLRRSNSYVNSYYDTSYKKLAEC